MAGDGLGHLPAEPGSAVESLEPAQLDGSGWDRIIRRHNRRVVLSLIAIGVRCHRAEDLAQAAWTRLIEQQRGGKLARLEFPGIAIAQARFLALSDLRRERLERRYADAGLAEAPLLASLADDPERRLLSEEQYRRVLAIIAGSSLSTQKLFRLLYAEPARPHADVARELGISVQRVRQTLCELRAKLRGALFGEL